MVANSTVRRPAARRLGRQKPLYLVAVSLLLGSAYLAGAVLMTGAAVAHAPLPTAAHRAPVGAAMAKVMPADNSTGNNSSGDDDQGENDTDNSTACAGDGDGESQGGDGNETGSGNESGDVPGVTTLDDENNTTGDGNETGDTDDGGDSNDTGDSGNETACGSDPPVTFKEIGLPPGTNWSVAAGSPPITVTNKTFGHHGSILFNVTTGLLNYTITPPSGFGVARIVGPGHPSQTSVVITNTTTLTIRFAKIQSLTFSEKGLPAGDVWQVTIWSPLPHGGPAGHTASNTTTASGGLIVFSVVRGPWRFNVTEVPANFTAHPTHGGVGVGAHAVTKVLRFVHTHALVAGPLLGVPLGALSVRSYRLV